MELKDLLPVGSVVLLNDAIKKIVIMGIMPIKKLETGEAKMYDYVGVPYPEGFIGDQSILLFMHDQIQEVFFEGYKNDERDFLIESIQNITDAAREVVETGKP